MRKGLLLAGLVAFLPAAMGQEYKLALPGYHFEFPRDHGSHDDYRTEWWYYTGHLQSESGRRYGFEVTFFRVRVVPPSAASAATPWDLRHVALAHFAVTEIDGRQFRYYEKLNRLSPFTARAASGRLDVSNEGWRAFAAPDGSWRLLATEGGDSIDLRLRSLKPPAIHGQDGVSVKAEGLGYASHYYSMTRLSAEGTLAVRGRAPEPVRGLAWMDHEFGSAALRENQTGWDWFSIQLDNDTELMLYQIRRSDGSPDVTSSGSFITASGEVIHIRNEAMRIRARSRWKSRRSGATYPMEWDLSIPSLNLRLEVKPLLLDQELITRQSTQVTYWEGAVSASGSFGGTVVRGAGYVEMTGYERPFRN